MLFAIDIIAFQTDFLLPYFPLIVAAFVASAGITALMYMLGNALRSQEMLAMSKDSLSNLVFSGILVFMFVAIFELFSQIAAAIVCNGPCDYLEVAYYAIVLLRTKLLSLYGNLYFYEIIFGFLSTLGFSIPLSALNPLTLGSMLISMPQFSFAPLSGLTPISNAHTIIVEAVGTALLMALARQVILEFIIQYFAVFFMLGICLRSFAFTRKTGSSILALSAVAYFVYPLAILFTNYMIFEVYHPTNFGVVPTTIGFCDDPKELDYLSEQFKAESDELYGTNLEKRSSNWYAFENTLVSGMEFLAKFANTLIKTLVFFDWAFIFRIVFSPILFKLFFDFMIMEVQVLIQFLVLTFVSFFLEIVIVITAYRSVASFIEGETEIFGISKLI